MIYINKDKVPPDILKENADQWTKEFKDNLELYGEYKKIPDKVKNSMWKNYRHDDIKKKLFESSHQKCAFCESIPGESGNIEVEHFKPKSLYPDLAFDWNNFLPVCRKCNDSKSSHDTGKEPIVNPTVVNPETIFTYDFLDIKPIREGDSIAERTIEVCNLNAERLYDARSKLLKSLSGYRHRLRDYIRDIELADTTRKKRNKINTLKDSLEILEDLVKDEEKYAGFCRNFLNNSSEYQQAKDLLREISEKND